MKNAQYAGSYANLVNAQTKNLCTLPACVLGILCATNGGGGTIQLYDSATTTTTDPLTAAIVPVAGAWLPLNMSTEVGLYAVLTGTLNVTVVYAAG
jgi:hypothetical protein